MVSSHWAFSPAVGALEVKMDESNDNRQVCAGIIQKEFICDPENISNGFCNSNHTGQFLLAQNATEKSISQIYTAAVHLNNTGPPINYPIKKTGYYCVGTTGLWAFLYVQHREDILPVQNYITAIIVFLIVEMLMTWGFYDYLNRSGSNIGSKALMIIVAVLNAGRNSFSFFLLLIVCMGYGVVKPSLVRPWFMTLNDRKQTTKAGMYRKLWWCILLSIIVIFGFFFFNSFTFASASDPDFVPFHWKSRWFILDGWLNIVYLLDVAFVAWVWRPSANNRRFAMSDELAQDDEGFEIADFGAEDDDEDDVENSAARRGDQTQSGQGARYDPPPGAHTAKEIPRESIDGETIFAVGEDGDRWSDDDDDSEAGKKLWVEKRMRIKTRTLIEPFNTCV
ncbi:hypothetical protein DID88_007258 [Monilinia fructigena]|uniref:Uncharacterized protein n=1 Tax=Monilinia fructigena TaxID=38457 RepID=A0A395J871_9HELO|nr:hypothetical protein DID88_007258 [Monilinia fructigena]